jgi:hypothetical protein
MTKFDPCMPGGEGGESREVSPDPDYLKTLPTFTFGEEGVGS